MINKISFDLVGAVITKENLINLMSIIDKYTNFNNSLSITYSNGIKKMKLTKNDLERELFENKKIDSISIHAYSHKHNGSENTINLQKEMFDNLYIIEISSDKNETYLSLKDDIENWIIHISPHVKYIEFIHSNTPYFICAFVYIILFFVSFYNCILNHNHSILSIISYIFSLLFFPICYVGISIIRFLFPLTELDIGVNSPKKCRWMISGVTTLIILPILINLLTMFF